MIPDTWKLADSLVNIDLRPTIVAELQGRIDAGDNGKPTLVPVSPVRWNAVLGRLVGKQVVVTVARLKGRRSDQANRYLWGAAYPAVLEGLRELAASVNEACPFGSTEDLHAAMKHMVLGTGVVNIPGGGTLDIPASTTRLTSDQFAAYIEAVAKWAAERGIYVPQPNEEMSA